MALSQAMSTAVTGLLSHQTAMDTLGNNLANINTTAYKGYDYDFSTLFSQTISGGIASDSETGRGSINPVQIGLGTQTGSISQNFDQGGFETTDNDLDFALEGNGWFVLRDGNSYVYTRDGSFYLGDESELLAADGLQVQGVMADDNGNINDTGIIEDIFIPLGEVSSGHETSEVSFTGNLDARSDVATGTMLISAAVADADASEWIGDDATVNGTAGSWTVLNQAATSGSTAVSMINGGSVQTSSAYAVYDATAGTYSAASLNTDLANLYYLSGDTWVKAFDGITDGETITTTFDKGGIEYEADFTYDITENSYTLEDFMEFLCGDVDRTSDVTDVGEIEASDNTDLDGGIMGTVAIAGHVSAADGGVSGYDVPAETGGAYTRTGYTSVDYGTGIDENSFNVSIVSNLGSDNAISNISISYNNVTHEDMFSADSEYGYVEEDTGTTTTLTVYDSLGNPVNLEVTLTLVEQDTNFSTYRWEATSTSDTDATWSIDENTGEIATNCFVGTGTIRFDANGNYVDYAEYSESEGISITLNDQGVNSPLTIDVNNALTSGTQDLDFSSMTFVSLDDVLTLKDQNGFAPGTLESFQVTTDGVIQGVYSNGVVEDIARMVVAIIPNENGLVSAGDNLYYTSPSSGDAQIEFANVGGRATVLNGQLEMSNVDMSEEFTELISIQRGYEANTKIITASDEMLQELLRMKA